MKPRVIIFAGYGFNCEVETKFAFEQAGALAEVVHINDLIDGKKNLANYQIAVFPGGFSFGDDTGSGNAYAQKVKNHLWEEIKEFISKDKLVIGICNGFQVLVNLGLLPALDGKYGQREVALLNNNSARYLDRWVDLKVENDTPWLKGIEQFSTAISHGEGRFFAPEQVLKQLNEKNLVALRYFKGSVCQEQNLEGNPNGALEDIAGVTDETKRIFGLMPHPERGMFFTQLPNWTYIKEELLRAGKPLPVMAAGFQVFENGVKYFK